MLPALTQNLMNNWEKYFPSENRPDKINYLGALGSVQGRTTTFLGFADKLKKPSFVVKVHRDSAETEMVNNEKEVLAKIQGYGGSFAGSVPRLITCEKIDGSWALVQSVVGGYPMNAAITNDGKPELNSTAGNMHIIKEWLVEFNMLNKKNGKTSGENNLRAIDEFEKVFELSAAEKDFLDKTRKELETYKSDKNLTVISHGDFCRHNILVSKSKNDTRIGVIDWTFVRPQSLPVHDLFFFISTYFLQIRKHYGIEGFIKAFEETFFTVSSYSNIAKDCIIDYCRRMGINLSFIKFHFGMFLVEQALMDYHQLIKCAKQGGLPRFAVYLASFKDKSYGEAKKEQLWTYFFRFFVENKEKFII